MLEKTLESPMDCREIQPVNPKGNQSWVFVGGTDDEAETPMLWPHDAKNSHWKRPWCCERLKTGGEGDDRGWDGWMTSLMRSTWVWVDSGSWWWTGKPGVSQSMRSQSWNYWGTKLNWTVCHSPNCDLLTIYILFKIIFISVFLAYAGSLLLQEGFLLWWVGAAL